MKALIAIILASASLSATAETINFKCVDLRDGKVGLRMSVKDDKGYETVESRFIKRFVRHFNEDLLDNEGWAECKAYAQGLNEKK